jgi:hypothetical protein
VEQKLLELPFLGISLAEDSLGLLRRQQKDLSHSLRVAEPGLWACKVPEASVNIGLPPQF